MCGASRVSPVRAKKNDFVGAVVASPSDAAPWAKLVKAQPKQRSAANFILRKDTLFKAMKLPKCVNKRNDTSEFSPRNWPGIRYRRNAESTLTLRVRHLQTNRAKTAGSP